jgi:phosphate-selective porin OprO/OprP
MAWYDEDGGDRYLHLGAAYYLNAPGFGLYRSRSIPEIFVGEYVRDPDPLGSSGVAVPTLVEGTPFFVDTGILRKVSLVNTYGTEALWVHGPLSWQTEVMGQHIDSAEISNALLWGGYSQVGFFLTGEHRPYDRKLGAIDRVIPNRSLNKKRDGWGALEIAARWSYLDLTDREVRGGTMDNATFGLNWFVNPYCKVVFNYIHSNSESRKIRNGVVIGNELIEARTDAYGLRCQFDF